MVRILGFHCHGLGSVPGGGTEIPRGARHGQNKDKPSKEQLKQPWKKQKLVRRGAARVLFSGGLAVVYMGTGGWAVLRDG